MCISVKNRDPPEKKTTEHIFIIFLLFATDHHSGIFLLFSFRFLFAHVPLKCSSKNLFIGLLLLLLFFFLKFKSIFHVTLGLGKIKRNKEQKFLFHLPWEETKNWMKKKQKQQTNLLFFRSLCRCSSLRLFVCFSAASTSNIIICIFRCVYF